MQHGNNLKEYTIEAPAEGMDVVPRQVMPQGLSRPFPVGKKTIRQIPAISGNNLTSAPGGSTIFSLNYGRGAGFMVNGSCYIKLTIAVTQDAGGTWGWAGATPNNDASSTILRATLMAGGTNIEQINQYWLFKGLANAYFTNAAASNVSALTSGNVATVQALQSIPYSQINIAGTGANGVFNSSNCLPNKLYSSTDSVTVCIPLALSLLNSTHGAYLPLSILASPLQIQLDWNQAAAAFYSATQSVTSFSISNASIVYETVAVPESYENTLRAQMQAGKLYQLPMECCLTSQFAGGATISYQLAVNLSSVNAVFVGAIIANNVGDSSKTKYFSASSGSTSANDVNTVSLRQLYFDGSPVWSGLPLVNTDSQLASELLRAITANCNNGDYSWAPSSIGDDASLGSFRGSYYVRGFNCRNFSEESLQGTGMPVSVMNYQENDNLSAASSTYYMFVLYSATALIDANGAMSVVR